MTASNAAFVFFHDNDNGYGKAGVNSEEGHNSEFWYGLQNFIRRQWCLEWLEENNERKNINWKARGNLFPTTTSCAPNSTAIVT